MFLDLILQTHLCWRGLFLPELVILQGDGGAFRQQSLVEGH